MSERDDGKDTGGPAYPTGGNPGLSVRDAYAIAALQSGLIPSYSRSANAADRIAAHAFEIAEACMRQRKL